MGNIARLPFTEMFEVLQKEWIKDGATDSATENIYKGHINQAYINFLPQLVNEDYLRRTKHITTKADYSTGTVDVATSGTTITSGDTATAWTSALTDGGLLRVTGKNTVMRVGYSSAITLNLYSLDGATSLTWPEAAVDEGSYLIVHDRYALASDFGRMVMDKHENGQAVYYHSSGQRTYLDPLTNAQFNNTFQFTHSTPGEYTVKKEFALDDWYLYLNPPPTDAKIIYYDYIPILTNLTEYTTGTCTFALSTALVGSGTAWSTALDTDAYDYYVRNDADGTGSKSLWFKVSTASTATAITITETFTGTTGAGASYTIATVSKYPGGLDRAMMLMAAIMTDPEAAMKEQWMKLYLMDVQGYSTLGAKAILGLMADVKDIYRKK